MRERALTVVDEVIALRVARRGKVGRRAWAQSPRHAARVQTRGIDHDVRRKLDRAAVDVDGESQLRAVAATARAAARTTASDPRACSKSPRNASINEWLSTMPVEGDHSPAAPRTAGSSARTFAADEPFEVIDAVGESVLLQRRELRTLLVVDRDDDLAATSVRNALLAQYS